jgi:hypothetical protein
MPDVGVGDNVLVQGAAAVSSALIEGASIGESNAIPGAAVFVTHFASVICVTYPEEKLPLAFGVHRASSVFVSFPLGPNGSQQHATAHISVESLAVVSIIERVRGIKKEKPATGFGGH